MTITERSNVTAALRRALALSPARASAIAAVAQSKALPEEAVAECWPRCCLCQVELAPADEHFNDGHCDECVSTPEADVFNLLEDGHA